MSDRADEFYVGYLPVPRGYRRFLSIVVPMLLLGPLIAGVVFVRFQRPAGEGVWLTGDEHLKAWVGVMHAEPYPWLQVIEGPEVGGADAVGEDRGVPVVEMAKLGAQERAAGLDGQIVKLEGWRIDRDGRTLIEIFETSALPDDSREAPPVREQALGRVRLSGEIVDYKCYLGAMKPGDGMGHQACARLCVSGGIPPVMIASGIPGGTHAIVVGPDGGSAADLVIPFIGMPVKVTGLLYRSGGLLYVRVDDGGLSFDR